MVFTCFVLGGGCFFFKSTVGRTQEPYTVETVICDLPRDHEKKITYDRESLNTGLMLGIKRILKYMCYVNWLGEGGCIT